MVNSLSRLTEVTILQNGSLNPNAYGFWLRVSHSHQTRGNQEKQPPSSSDPLTSLLRVGRYREGKPSHAQTSSFVVTS